MTSSDLTVALSHAGVRDVSFSRLDRAAYSSDASSYRVVPAAVVRPHDRHEVAATLDVCRSAGVAVTCRGAGTSIAGNAIGAGVVLDFSRYMNDILSVDAAAGEAVVQPGVVHAQLQRAVAPFGLRFGPDPSTHTRCTIGGMIGNNACGSHALRYGRTSDNIRSLDVLTAAGEQMHLNDPDSASASLLTELRDITSGGLATIRTELGRFGRQVSGYALENLLPERGFDVRRLLVGSEGTLAVAVEAVVRLVPEPRHHVLAVLGYPDMATAADAAPGTLRHRPAACEGLDSRIVDVVRSRRGPGAVPALPRGSGWLFVELTGDTLAEAVSAAWQVVADSDALDSIVVIDPTHAKALWQIREDGAGLVGRTQQGEPTHPGWEDSAVPPTSLGSYLRELEDLLREHKLTGLPYGHFGDGCVHLRLDFPLSRPDGPRSLRQFMLSAAKLVARYGGSLSGEHGDGRARSELLPLMYSPAALDLFRQVKEAFDPGYLLNPEILVRPRPLDADLRSAAARPIRNSLMLAYRHDRGDFSAAVHRCTGVGKCRANTIDTGGIMCPSFMATGNETDSTRGRARVLQEMVNGSLVNDSWRAREVHEALDLCLACKACKSECPTGVDMAAYKAEVLHQAYSRRLRPRSHYALGQLPRWARMASIAPGLANAMLRSRGLSRVARFAAGVDSRRSLPVFAPTSFRAWYRHQPRATEGKPVVLLVDTFTNYFAPDIAIAATKVLKHAGFSVSIPDRPTCCAITWISTGQLGAARRILRRTVSELVVTAQSGIPIVGLEPSCTATLRSDAVDILDTTHSQVVADSIMTLGEVLATASGWAPPSMSEVRVVAQPHCHHSAISGWEPDAELLRRTGAHVTQVAGCCGLAGNFGVERGHYDVSVAVARTALLPAVEAASQDALLLADGFSCRTQLADLAGRESMHIAQFLASGLSG